MILNELNLLKEGEEYSFVKDLREGMAEGLRQPLADKIFATLPDHVFHDIKKPLEKEDEMHWHKYNPARANPNQNFFDMRRHEDYHRRQELKQNMREDISFHRLY